MSLIREKSRNVRTSRWVESVLSDIRYGARALRRFPVFTIVAVCSLGVGLGANTAIFGITYAILFEPLSIRDPDRLVALQRVENGSTTSAFSRAERDSMRTASRLAITGSAMPGCCRL